MHLKPGSKHRKIYQIRSMNQRLDSNEMEFILKLIHLYCFFFFLKYKPCPNIVSHMRTSWFFHSSIRWRWFYKQFNLWDNQRYCTCHRWHFNEMRLEKWTLSMFWVFEADFHRWWTLLCIQCTKFTWNIHRTVRMIEWNSH